MRKATSLRAVFCLCVLFTVSAACVRAEDSTDNQIVANPNRVPAGKLENGILALQLELRNGVWHPEADDGAKLFMPAIAEAGHQAQIPGPLVRIPEGTTVHAKITNKLREKATVYGLNTRPGDPNAGVELAPGETKEWNFLAGVPGTYFYWARTSEPFKTRRRTIPQPIFTDSHMNAAFIVDPAGPVPPDRIFVVNTMFAPADILHEAFDFEVVSINGKSYPYTEQLEYTEGENIRWRVINPSFSEHPMHLHGAFYKVLSRGDFESDKLYPESERQSVVTEDVDAGRTMMLEWKPEHAGRWLFHCHFHAHISSDERIPVVTHVVPSVYDPPPPIHEHHDAMDGMNDMAGLVLPINVKAATSGSSVPFPSASAHKIDLVIEPTTATGKTPTFTCAVREGKKIVASEDKAMGPPIVVTRGEPAEITVLNHLNVPTTIHWHGIELDSYYDGVIGGGTGNQVTPAIAPGTSFTARFTPNHAGTFIYHTHAPDPHQLSGGVYGALIVLEPGEQFDPVHDKVMVVGTRDFDFVARRLTLNGSEEPAPLMLNRGEKYRLRLINIAPNLAANFEIGTKDHPATWRAIAKDGAYLPSSLAKTSAASLRFASGETYDFEFQPQVPGEIPLQITNAFSPGTVAAKMVVQ